MNTFSVFIVYYNLSVSGVTQKIIDIVNDPTINNLFNKIIIVLRRRGPHSMESNIQNKKVRVYYFTDTLLSHLPFCFPLFVLGLTILYKPRSILSFCYMPSLAAALVKTVFFRIHLTTSIVEDFLGLDRELHYNVPFIRKALLSLIRRKANKVIAINHMIGSMLEHSYGFPRNKIQLIRNWYKPLSVKKTEHTTKVFDLVYIGRIERDKNLMRVLKTIKVMVKRGMPVSFCIVGSGSLEKLVKNYIIQNKLSAHVSLVGFTLNTISYLKKSSIFILPSDNEGSPLALLDAMHYGLPVLCWQFAGVKEIVTDGQTGYVFHNQKELIERFNYLLHHPLARSNMGKRANEYVNRLYNPKNIHSYLACISS